MNALLGGSAAMNLLVTAGGTIVPIDRVRHISNGFTGRTGAKIALHAHACGHRVTLLTSHPDVLDKLPEALPADEHWSVRRYRTFDDLHREMGEGLKGCSFDAVIHSAAVSDYRVAGVFAPVTGSAFRDGAWTGTPVPALRDRSAAKVKSDEPELWLRMVKTPKLIDLIRTEWNFRGIVVKFKLEVEVADDRLVEIAERSRIHSSADLMVANSLDGLAMCAYLGPVAGRYERVSRPELSARLIDAVAKLHRERTHG
jgi:phosphopantothenoylcysteine synthetase/decarboxylase